MNERIKQIRRALDMTQQAFASKIGTTANVLTNWETGRRNPSASAINNICKTFNVNESWFRYGTGEMFVEIPQEDELASYISLILEESQNPFCDIMIQIMKTYAELTPKSQEALQEFCSKLKSNMSKEKEEA